MSTSKEVFGVPLAKGLINQLNYRQQLKGHVGDEDLSAAHHMLLHGKGAWITLTSCVNTVDEETLKYEESQKEHFWNYYWGQKARNDVNRNRRAKNKENNLLARSNILTGGTVSYNYRESDGKLVKTQRRDVSLNEKESIYGGGSSITSTVDRGFTPMMGITGLKVKSKSTYGSLREIELDIIAHNQTQLSVLENLYFRPGFDMLIEFGNAAYLDEKGEIRSFPFGNSSNFLRGADKQGILDKIKRDREKSGYNYDGVISKVINFSWDLNPEGSYDCTLKLITSGEVMESISAVKHDTKTSGARKALNGDDTKSDLLLNVFKACKALVFSDSQEKTQENINKQSHAEALGEYITDSKTAEEYKEDKKRIKALAPITVESVAETYGLEESDIKNNIVISNYRNRIKSDYDDEGNEKITTYLKGFDTYISLAGLAIFLNKLIVDKHTGAKAISKFNTDPSRAKWVNFVGNISNDPYKCGKPLDIRTAEAWLYRDVRMYGYDESSPQLTKSNKAPGECLRALKKFSKAYEDTFSIDSPYFLFISFNELIKIQRSFIESTKNNPDNTNSIFSFYKKVLDTVSSSFAGTTKLDLHLDPTIQRWVIVDRNLYEPVVDKKDMPVLNLVGKSSIVTNFSLNSKISSKLASALSIAASGGGSAAVEGLFQYNKGLADRYDRVPDYDIEQAYERSSQKSADSDELKEARATIVEAYREYLKSTSDEDAFSSISSDHKFYSNYARTKSKELTSSKTGKPRSYDGLIPIDLSFTMDGMSGFKPGEAFVIGGKVLPSRYEGSVGFVITKVEHTIDTDNRWETDISTKMFMLPEKYTGPKNNEDEKTPQEKAKYQKSDSKVQPNVKSEYGEPGDETQLTTIKVPTGYNMTYAGKPVRNIRIHKNISSNLTSALEEIKSEYGLEKIKDLRINIYNGSFNDRNKRNGQTKSMHAWGIALDFDADNNKLSWKRDKASFARPEYKQFLAIFKKHGFYNLGTEKNYDYMHFQAWDPNQAE